MTWLKSKIAAWLRVPQQPGPTADPAPAQKTSAPAPTLLFGERYFAEYDAEDAPQPWGIWNTRATATPGTTESFCRVFKAPDLASAQALVAAFDRATRDLAMRPTVVMAPSVQEDAGQVPRGELNAQMRDSMMGTEDVNSGN